MQRGPVSRFAEHHFRHFNAAALMDAAKGWEQHLADGGKMFLTLAGAMSTAELGLSLAEMIRQDKVHAICCTGANLEEDVFNLVAHDDYVRIPQWRDLTAEDEKDLLERHLPGHLDDAGVYKMLARAAGASGRESDGHQYLAEYHYQNGRLEKAAEHLELASKVKDIGLYQREALAARLKQVKEEIEALEEKDK